MNKNELNNILKKYYSLITGTNYYEPIENKREYLLTRTKKLQKIISNFQGGIMKYIIMSDGKGTRWNNYLGITKQEAIINNERLIDRTIRMILERSTDEIYILSSNQNHENKYAKRMFD